LIRCEIARLFDGGGGSSSGLFRRGGGKKKEREKGRSWRSRETTDLKKKKKGEPTVTL